MTTIVWDGQTLAADKQATHNGTVHVCTKIRRLKNGEVLAWCGTLATGLLMADLYEKGRLFKEFPSEYQNKTETAATLVIARPGRKVSAVYTVPFEVLVEDFHWAWGSGKDNALGAMTMGADAVKAIEVATRWDEATGFGVDSFLLPHR